MPETDALTCFPFPLGDRVAIMSLGEIQCIGSSQFLKTTYGAGYKLIFAKDEGFSNDDLANLTSYVTKSIPDSKHVLVEGEENQVLTLLFR